MKDFAAIDFVLLWLGFCRKKRKLKTYSADDYGRAGKNNKQVSSPEGSYPKDKRACSITGQDDNQFVMTETCELILCGVRASFH